MLHVQLPWMCFEFTIRYDKHINVDSKMSTIYIRSVRKDNQPKGVVNDASARPPNLSSASCDFDL